MDDKSDEGKEPWLSGFYMPTRYFLLFMAQFVPYMATALMAEIFEAEGAGMWTSAMSAVFAMTVAGTASIVGTVIITNTWRCLMALIDALLVRPTKKSDQIRAEGRAEGKAEGRAEGKAEGRAEGYTEGATAMATAMLAWVQERDEHAKRGEPFDKPPPGINGINKNDHA